MTFTEAQLQKRKPIWKAFSAFYLDTELTDKDLDSIVVILKSSDFSVKELAKINQEEVAPILHSNLLSTAGVWDEFDQDWLSAAITKRLEKPSWRVQFGNWLYRSYRQRITQEHWQKVLEKWGKTAGNTDQ